MSTTLPRLLRGLIDDAAVFPPGSAPLPEALAAHRQHRASWYADLVGPLLVPVSALVELAALLDADETIEIGLIVDVPVDQLAERVDQIDARVRTRQVEVAVARRGEDPLPGLAALAELPERLADADVHAEIPLSWGLMSALDVLVEQRSSGRRIAAKFRTGGLAAELFPAPAELAAVICACRDRELPFKLTAGLHHAIRHVDPETGITHHGFGNVLAAVASAHEGATPAAVTDLLATTDPLPLVEAARAHLDRERPLWISFGSCSVSDPLVDLIRLGLIIPEV